MMEIASAANETSLRVLGGRQARLASARALSRAAPDSCRPPRRRCGASRSPRIASSAAGTSRASTSGWTPPALRTSSSAILCRVSIPTTATSSSCPRPPAPTTRSCRASCSTPRRGPACGSPEHRARARDEGAHPAHRAAGDRRGRAAGVGVRSGAGGVRASPRCCPDATVARVRGEPREILALLERPHARRRLQPLRGAARPARARAARGRAARVGGRALHRVGQRDAGALPAQGSRRARCWPRPACPCRDAGGFPCIVKPADQDGSAGIDHDSICEDAAALARARARVVGSSRHRGVPARARVRRVAVGPGASPSTSRSARRCFQQGLRLNHLRRQVGHRERRLRQLAALLRHRPRSAPARRRSWPRRRARGAPSARAATRGSTSASTPPGSPECSTSIPTPRSVPRSGSTARCSRRGGRGRASSTRSSRGRDGPRAPAR